MATFFLAVEYYVALESCLMATKISDVKRLCKET